MEDFPLIVGVPYDQEKMDAKVWEIKTKNSSWWVVSQNYMS